jgi:hypothetical protein
MPVGPLLCVVEGPTRGRLWASDDPTSSIAAGARPDQWTVI